MSDISLDRDSWDLHKALSELVRVYQFRDRKCICCHDVSVTQCYAIGALVGRGAMQLKELATELHLDKSTASRTVDSLEAKNYVRRTSDPGDGRAVRLEITQRGRELHATIERDLVQEMKNLIVDFDPEIRQATSRLMARLARAASERFSRWPEKK